MRGLEASSDSRHGSEPANGIIAVAVRLDCGAMPMSE